MAARQRQILLKAHPKGTPQDSDFEIVEKEMPTPGPGEMLLRTLWLSIDPYQRGRISGVKSYAEPVPIGGVIEGGTICEVADSNLDGFAPGDIVEGRLGWQSHGVTSSRAFRKVDASVDPLSLHLGALGMPGLTAYFGLLKVGLPKAGETVLVSSAAGAVGSVVGQIARIHGCRAVGIAGSSEKCDYVVRDLGFDACFNYRDAKGVDAMEAAIRQHCPDGVDVFFDNVGGETLDAALRAINLHGRIVICGMISLYDRPNEPDHGIRPMRQLLNKRARMEGVLYGDWLPQREEGVSALTAWWRDGKLHTREHVVEGLENAPEAMRQMLRGDNFGKTLVKVA